MEEVVRLYAHEKGVAAVCFSPDGNYLFSVGNEDNHSLIVWDWQQKKIIKQTQIGKEKVFLIKINPYNPALFLTLGIKHLRQWTWDSTTATLNSQPVSFTSGSVQVPPPKASLSILFLGEQKYVVGTSDGDICFFNNGVIEKSISLATPSLPANELLVSALIDDSDRNRIIVGHGEGKISFYDKETHKLLHTINLDSFSPSQASLVIRSMSLERSTQNLLIGTKGNEIFSLSINDSTASIKYLLGGHRDELWALAVHPSSSFFVTGSNDKTIRFWNYVDRKIELDKVLVLDEQVKSLAFHPLSSPFHVSSSSSESNSSTGLVTTPVTHLAIGLGNKEQRKGGVRVVNYETMDEVHRVVRNNIDSVDALKFSPSGKFLAAGCGNVLEVYATWDYSKPPMKLSGHASRITHLDWSIDNRFIMTNSTDYEILFWSIQSGARINPQSVRDVQWSTWTCVLGWGVQGIWPEGSDGTDINALQLSNDAKVIVTGDDFGTVKLFEWPSVQTRSPHHEYTGHSSHVTNVRFTFDDSRVITLGGNDTGIFQWKYVKSPQKVI